jgi:flagellar motor switch protein FliN/FliY
MADEEKQSIDGQDKENSDLDASSSPGGELSQDDIDKRMKADDGSADSQGEADPEQDKLAEEWAKALDAGEEIKEGQPLGGDIGQAEFDELTESKPTGPSKELDFILDIPLEVTVEMGRTRMLINDLLQLGQGSVIELNRLAGEPLDVLVNNKLVARGEVVVVGEKFGIRITDIVSPMERVKRLK